MAQILTVFKAIAGLGETEKEFNFPICLPFMYHSIRDCEKRIYLVILGIIEIGLLNLVLAVNWLGALFAVIVDPKNNIGLIALASAYLIFIPFCFSFFVFYWSLYKACLTRNIIRFIVAIVIWSLGILWMIFLAVGTNFGGGCGIISAIGLIDTTNQNGFRTFVMIWHFAMVAVFLANALFMLVIVICMIVHAKMDGEKPKMPEPAEKTVQGEVGGMVRGAVVSTALGM